MRCGVWKITPRSLRTLLVTLLLQLGKPRAQRQGKPGPGPSVSPPDAEEVRAPYANSRSVRVVHCAEHICPLMPSSFQGCRPFQQKRSPNAYYMRSFYVSPQWWHSGYVPLWSSHLTLTLLTGTQVSTGQEQGVHLVQGPLWMPAFEKMLSCAFTIWLW